MGGFGQGSRWEDVRGAGVGGQASTGEPMAGSRGDDLGRRALWGAEHLLSVASGRGRVIASSTPRCAATVSRYRDGPAPLSSVPLQAAPGPQSTGNSVDDTPLMYQYYMQQVRRGV